MTRGLAATRRGAVPTRTTEHPPTAPYRSADVIAPVEDRLVFTVELVFTVKETAKLLGVSCSLAYEAVQRGEIPSMQIGRRILVPKAAFGAVDRYT